MVNVVSRKCIVAGCMRRPTVGKLGSRRATHCSVHKGGGMVDMVNRRCREVGCERIPSFGPVGGRASHCQEHRSPGMVNVRSRRCVFEGCTRQPLYAHPGEKPAFCGDHKEVGMVDVVNRKCNEPGCARLPCFGMPGDRKASLCVRHKSAGMVDVKSRKCMASGCSTRPSFALPGDKATHCFDHAPARLLEVIEAIEDTEGQPASARLLEVIEAMEDTEAVLSVPYELDDDGLYSDAQQQVSSSPALSNHHEPHPSQSQELHEREEDVMEVPAVDLGHYHPGGAESMDHSMPYTHHFFHKPLHPAAHLLVEQ